MTAPGPRALLVAVLLTWSVASACPAADEPARPGVEGEGAGGVPPFAGRVKLPRGGVPPPPIPPEGTLVLFPEGDRLQGIIGPAGETALEVNSDMLGELSVPLEAL